MLTDTKQPDITLASTTESQAELDHATGPNWREHFDPEKAKTSDDDKGKNGTAGEPAEKKDGTETESASAAGKTASKEGQKTEDDDENLPVGARKRIDRLTRRAKEAEDELARIRGTQRQPERQTERKTDANTDPEPVLKDFKTWEEWNAAHTRWAVRDENRTIEAKNAIDRANAEAKETYDAHLDRIELARTAHDDFDDVIKGMPVFEFSSPAARQAFQMGLVEADNGPEVMYHLAQHPEEMAKFADLSPVKVQMMLGRISGKLSPSTSASARTTAKTTTPKPTIPVRGTSKAPSDIYDESTVKDTDNWIKQRMAGIRSSKNGAN